jgi:hypothetical protein
MQWSVHTRDNHPGIVESILSLVSRMQNDDDDDRVKKQTLHYSNYTHTPSSNDIPPRIQLSRLARRVKHPVLA